MASQDDILTAHKNNVVAINGLNSTLTASDNRNGTSNSGEISATSVVKNSSGWVANVSVITAGSAVGYIYDTPSASSLTGKKLYTIPNTVGVYVVQMPCNNGITVIAGTAQVVNISYS
jgi:hypothetical protein